MINLFNFVNDVVVKLKLHEIGHTIQIADLEDVFEFQSEMS